MQNDHKNNYKVKSDGKYSQNVRKLMQTTTNKLKPATKGHKVTTKMKHNWP